jgi:hypothetical protein
MPTGYTYKLVEQGQSFPEFATQCARAFGACVMMRDDDPNTPIPEKFEPDPYHANKIVERKKELADLQRMTAEERDQFGQMRKAEAVKKILDGMAKDSAEDARIDEMMGHVNAWNPPTPEHEDLKKFMLDQLTISRHGLGFYQKRLKEIEGRTPAGFYADALEGAQQGLTYAIEANQKEIERAKARTDWIQKLRASLPTQ